MVTDGRGLCVALGPIFGVAVALARSQAQLALSWTGSVPEPGLEPQVFPHTLGQPHLSPVSSGGQWGTGLCRPEDSGEPPQAQTLS